MHKELTQIDKPNLYYLASPLSRSVHRYDINNSEKWNTLINI